MKYFLAVMILALLPVTGIVVYAHMLMHKRPFLKFYGYLKAVVNPEKGEYNELC